MKLLLVDDSKFLRMANERALTRAGYEVITASDGEEGLRIARDQRPDLIMLDMMLPKISGPEVLTQLKADQDTASIPVIVLSSLSQKNEVTLKEAGAVDFLEKSLLEKGPEALVAAVSRVFKKLA